MLTGSFASAYYAIPRATQDLDVVIATEEAGVEQIVQRLQEVEWYVHQYAALEAYRTRGQFNAIDPSSGWKAGFIIRKDRPYRKTESERRKRVSLLDLQVSISSLEDLLIAEDSTGAVSAILPSNAEMWYSSSTAHGIGSTVTMWIDGSQSWGSDPNGRVLSMRRRARN